jgi:hypothetical protein
MDATEMFLIRHKGMHAHVKRLTEGLSEEQIRERVHPLVNPLAWQIWHLARTEDSAVNLLIFDSSEVLDDAWCARLSTARHDAGTGMTMDEVVDLSTRVHLPSLMTYWSAVGERTAALVASLRPSDLDEIVSSERVHRFVMQTTAEPTRARLEKLLQNTTRGHILGWLPLTHNFEHIGQADLIRGLLGQPGPLLVVLPGSRFAVTKLRSAD